MVKEDKAYIAQEEKMADQNNIADAKETYAGFLTYFKWGTVAACAVTALVVLIIAS